MNTRSLRCCTAQRLAVVSLVAAVALTVSAPGWAQEQSSAAVQDTATGESVGAVEGISAAEQHYREGVALFRREKYREALAKFHQALAIDPALEKAKDMAQKCDGKIQLAATGGTASGRATFETFDVEDGASGQAGGDVRRARIKELMDEGEVLLENKKFAKALDKFNEVLLLSPENQTAQRLLAEATLGAYEETRLPDIWREVSLQHQMIRETIEESKLLPPGADGYGIKKFMPRFTVEEEEPPAAKEQSEIQKALGSPVSIEFDDEHINRIMDFIADYVGINIVVDERVVEPPTAAGLAGLGAGLGGPGSFPAPRGGRASRGRQTSARPRRGARPFGDDEDEGDITVGPSGSSSLDLDTGKVPGYVSYIKLDDVLLHEALVALLRPLNLDYAVQPGFLWISTPDRIRHETFEPLETRTYELRNLGSEILPKVIVSQEAGIQGTFSLGGSTGGLGGGGLGGGSFGGSFGGTGGGSRNNNRGGSRGGNRGGSGGGSSSGTFSNIEELFTISTGDDYGEGGAVVGTGGSTGTTGVDDEDEGGAGGGGAPPQLGGGGGLGGFTGEANLMFLLMNLIPPIIEPHPDNPREVSYMVYLPSTNTLVVHNTPSNLDEFEEMIMELDETPKQVSIESKFITINVTDLDKIGFTWDLSLSDQNSRDQQIDSVAGTTYNYDINGDGTAEAIPFYTRPNGSNVIENTVVDTVIGGLVNPGPAGNFNLSTIITDNEDGDQLSVTMQMLDTLTESELLSAPRVTTMNRKPAVIADLLTQTFNTGVETQLYVTDAAFGGTGTTSSSQNLEFTEFLFGITFGVTPQISGTDQVRLWLNPQVTTMRGVDTFTTTTTVGTDSVTTTMSYPRTSVQAVWTNVVVHDGDTLVLGGLVSDTTSRQTQKLPYVADLPVLGWFFRGKSAEINQSSLLIFVTVDIVDTMGARFYEASL